MSRPARPGRPPASIPQPRPQLVDTVILHEPVLGIANPPCCGQAGAPRLLRTRVVAHTRIADGLCPHCGHRLRITYEHSEFGWKPVTATDLSRNA
ncbi:MAG: hypothetical protein RL456_1804 [Pseudomonadota bacterium]|jgi:hypothetical protein